MTALEFHAEVGRANSCSVSANHTPVPLRYVWHHVQPQCCGGATTVANLANVCDSCHYAIHSILHELKMTGKVAPNRQYNKTRIALAQEGYKLCVAAGTVAQIPDEGGGFVASEVAE